MTQLETTLDPSLLTLQKAVLEALKKPQQMSEQLRTQLADHYACLTDEQIQAFFADGLLELEEYEQDLLFSPQFTLKGEERLAFASPFALNQYTKQDIEHIALNIEGLSQKITFTLNSTLEVSIPFTAVIAERFLKSLHLHKSLPQDLRPLMESEVPIHFQATVALSLRDEMFQFEKYQTLFRAIVHRLNLKQEWSQDQIDFVTTVIKTYMPQDLEDLTEKLGRLIQSCQEDMLTVETRSYHHPQILGSNMGSSHDLNEAKAIRDNYTTIIKNAQTLKDLLR